MAYFSAQNPDCLLEELNRHEQKLNLWLKSSAENALLFVDDPVSALRAAKIGISDQSLRDLEVTMKGIFEKLASA
jgi:hypothetical protein